MLPDAGNATPAKLEHILRACACLNVRKAARVVTQRYDEALRPAGIRSTQLPLLIAAALHGRINIGTMADEVVMDRTTLSRNLRLLSRKGWIRLSPGADRRNREVQVTARGRKVLGRAIPLWDRAQASVEREVGTDALRRLLRDVIARKAQTRAR